MILILVIIQWISLWVEMVKFGKLTTDNLPGATQNDIERMRNLSKAAFFIILVCFILIFVAFGFGPSPSRLDNTDAAAVEAYNSAVSTVNWVVLILEIVGLLLSGVFYAKAYQIKKRCCAQPVAVGAQSGSKPTRLLGIRILGGIAVIIGVILSTSTTLRWESGNFWMFLGILMVLGGLFVAIRPKV